MTESPFGKMPRRSRGFTLIEIIAVVAIMAMIFAIGIPRLGNSAWDPLQNEAENIAQSLRFARQRAIMTGVPHRLLIDLEEGGYLVEWFVVESRAFGEDGADDFSSSLSFALGSGPDTPTDDSDGPGIELTPPPRAERDYYPIRHRQMGSFRWLDDALYFVGVNGPTGWVEGGDYAIVFYSDGTTDPARLEIADFEDHHLTLEIEPILQQVHVNKGNARS